MITHSVLFEYSSGTKTFCEEFMISGLGKEKLILGLPWLQNHNPNIDWVTGEVVFRPNRKLRIRQFTGILDMTPPEILIQAKQIEEIHIRAKTSTSQTLAQAQEEKKRSLEELIPSYLLDFRSQFEKGKAERFPESRPYDHAIELKPDYVPKKQGLYRLNETETKVMEEFINENLRKKYIRPSVSPIAAPFFFVSKKEKGALRPCQDYRDLNSGTVKNAYPLPLVGKLLDKLKGATIFSKLDLRNGYNNIRIKDGDQWKAAFRTEKGLFEPMVMFFGLANSPATFQAFMDDTLSDFIGEGWCCVYMDDILIFSRNKEEHRIRTRRLLERLANQDLFLKPEKCEFDVTEVNFLGMIIRPGHVAMDPTKLAGIKDWLPPDSVTGVRSFLGFGNFYRKFIGKFGEIVKPLNDLTKKGAAFIWSKECQSAFDALKQKFLKEPILIIPDPDKPFLLETDASKWASGGVLRQKGPDGEWHPCGYISHSFNQAERNYQIYDRELLAMIRALKEWRHYLMGGKFPFVILSDHDNLRYFRKPQDLNPRQARWLLFLSEFNFKMVHTPGKQLIQADALSRRPDHVTDEDENQQTILLPDHLFINSVHFELESEIRDKLSKDDFHKAALESLLHDGVTPIKSALSDWKIDDGIIKFRGKTYVPDDLETRRRIVKEIHESFGTGHPGQYLTQELVQRSYWWPGLAKFVKNFVDGCVPCQQMKINTHPTRTPLIPIPGTPNALPFQICTMDLITDLPEVDGFDSIMVVVDHSSTKGVIFTPCTKTLNAEGAAKLLLDNLY
ncbi:hypothetical protein MPER_13203 [Moniliophthora perniciosa FA553]|nr:hypothetical protein MPER_13203 [Moniliophthora perniciosa FA553]